MKKPFRPWPMTQTFYSTLFFGFIYLPLGVVVIYSFNSNPLDMSSWQSFTFDWYLGIFGMKEVDPSLGSSAIYVESTDQLLKALKI